MLYVYFEIFVMCFVILELICWLVWYFQLCAALTSQWTLLTQDTAAELNKRKISNDLMRKA